jgi:hypothetical protein
MPHFHHLHVSFLLIFLLGEITLYLPEVSINFHFFLQSLKCDTLPSQTFKLWQFNPFGLFIPKMPSAIFFFKKKIQKKKKQKTGWPNHPIAGHHLWGGLATLVYIYIFLVFFFL